MRGRPIRASITATAVAVMSCAVAIAAIALLTLVHRSLVQDVDNRARQRLDDLVAIARQGQTPRILAGTDEDGTVAQLVGDGIVLTQSPIIRPSARILDYVPQDDRVVVCTIRHAPIAGGSSYRVAVRRVPTPSGSVLAYAGASLEPVTDSMHTIQLLLSVVGPALVIVVGVMTWWLVGRTLRPVEALREQVAQITATDLTARVTEPRTGDEIDRLAETMNGMLGRLDAAIGRQRRFLSDAAHELRSPLAAIRGELQLAHLDDDGAGRAAAVERLTISAGRLERLVEDLFVLATADEQGASRHGVVDFDDIVLRQVESARSAHQREVVVAALDAARVNGDHEQLERLVANLLDNAVHHAKHVVVVELRVINDPPRVAEFAVSDDGPGVPAEFRDRIFDRFSRADDARDRRHGGAGLGLAIVRHVAEEHGGTVQLADSEHGARLVVHIPTAGGDADPVPREGPTCTA